MTRKAGPIWQEPLQGERAAQGQKQTLKLFWRSSKFAMGKQYLISGLTWQINGHCTASDIGLCCTLNTTEHFALFTVHTLHRPFWSSLKTFYNISKSPVTALRVENPTVYCRTGCISKQWSLLYALLSWGHLNTVPSSEIIASNLWKKFNVFNRSLTSRPWNAEQQQPLLDDHQSF